MKVRFWGVRGSVATPEIDKLKVGGNTACIELELDNKRIILDAGTGIIGFGKFIFPIITNSEDKEINILLSHTHWDHIQGFPFLHLIYMPDIKINIYGPVKANRQLKKLISAQMEYDYFPVKFSHLPSQIEFYELSEGVYEIFDNIIITARRHIHPGLAFGYRIEYNGKVVVYNTDIEHFQNTLDKRVIELSENADILIHDAQYTDDEISYKSGWGHSTWKQAINVSKEANVKYLILFHHDSDRTDDQLFNIEKEAQKIFQNTFIAKEGLQIDL